MLSQPTKARVKHETTCMSSVVPVGDLIRKADRSHELDVLGLDKSRMAMKLYSIRVEAGSDSAKSA